MKIYKNKKTNRLYKIYQTTRTSELEAEDYFTGVVTQVADVPYEVKKKLRLKDFTVVGVR